MDPPHRFSKWLHIKDQALAYKQQINFPNNNQVFKLRIVAMATVVSQHVRHLGRLLDFSKILFCSKLQQILLKIVENMCFKASNYNKFCQKVTVFSTSTLICIIHYA